MEQNNLRKLKRDELLEIIVKQKKRIEELEEQVNKLEHADDQNLHLSFSDAGHWSDALRRLADMFENSEKAHAAAPAAENAADNAEKPVRHEEFDWHGSSQASAVVVPAKDASFIDLDDIKWPSNR